MKRIYSLPDYYHLRLLFIFMCLLKCVIYNSVLRWARCFSCYLSFPIVIRSFVFLAVPVYIGSSCKSRLNMAMTYEVLNSLCFCVPSEHRNFLHFSFCCIWVKILMFLFPNFFLLQYLIFRSQSAFVSYIWSFISYF